MADDATDELTATVTYRDAAANDLDTANASIIVMAAENSAPEFPETAIEGISVAEDSDVTTHSVGTYTAPDDDNDVLTYTLEGADKAHFSMETTGGDANFHASRRRLGL